MKIIAIGHRQSVGKDTTAKFLISQLRSLNSKVSVQRIGFADELKELALSAFGWAGLETQDYYENHREEKEKILPKLGFSPRQIYLDVGRFFNTICPTVFCELVMARAHAQIVIIPDLRRVAEANFLRKYNPITIKIIRNVPRLEDIHPGQLLDTELDSWDHWTHIIPNNGDLKDLNDYLKPISYSLINSLV